MTYNTSLIKKTFKYEFKALVSSFSKLVDYDCLRREYQIQNFCLVYSFFFCFSFAKQYIAAIRDNLKSGLNYSTITLCQKFQSLFDSAPFFHPSNSCSTDEPLSGTDKFSNFVDNIPSTTTDVLVIQQERKLFKY